MNYLGLFLLFNNEDKVLTADGYTWMMAFMIVVQTVHTLL